MDFRYDKIIYNTLYFLQKDDIMLHFTLSGSSDFLVYFIVYLESVVGLKFGFKPGFKIEFKSEFFIEMGFF